MGYGSGVHRHSDSRCPDMVYAGDGRRDSRVCDYLIVGPIVPPPLLCVNAEFA